MRSAFAFAALLSVLGHCVAVAATLGHTTLESDVPVHSEETSSWTKTGPASPSEVLHLSVQLSLEPKKRDALEAAFWAVSTPTNPRYGQHYSVAAIADLLGVDAGKVDRVKDFFVTAGALEATASPFNDVLTVRIRVADAERALRTTIGAYTHRERPEVGAIFR